MTLKEASEIASLSLKEVRERMIIVDNIINDRKFAEASIGDCFELEGDYYMKIPTVRHAVCDKIFNSVELCSGKLAHFEDFIMVRAIRLEAKVVW